MSPASDSPPLASESAPPQKGSRPGRNDGPGARRFWLRPQFSLGTLFWLMLVVGMAAVWWRDRSSLDQRLRKLEQMYAPEVPAMWRAADILGPPDDPTGGAGKSWCPERSMAVDWVEVGFDRPVPAATIDLYETYSLGCVTEVIVTAGSGDETSIWRGADPTTPTAPAMAQVGLFRVPVPSSIKSVQAVRIHVDSTVKGSWACIDAVGLTNASGQTTWATSSLCSTVYSGDLTATVKRNPWYVFW